jgi:hypothetical protein
MSLKAIPLALLLSTTSAIADQYQLIPLSVSQPGSSGIFDHFVLVLDQTSGQMVECLGTVIGEISGKPPNVTIICWNQYVSSPQNGAFPKVNVTVTFSGIGSLPNIAAGYPGLWNIDQSGNLNFCGRTLPLLDSLNGYWACASVAVPQCFASSTQSCTS